LAANVHNLYIKAKRDPDAIDYGHPLIKQVLEPTYNCLIGDTKIMTSEGEVTIQEIHDRDVVGLELPSYNEGTGEIEADVIEAVVRNGEKPVLTIELEDGESLTLTDDHRVYTTRGWIPAGELTLTDEILGIE
jgi:intein/homing endonuclease